MNKKQAAKIFDLHKDATQEQIKVQYRKLSVRFHPDGGNEDPERWIEIQEAYEVLTNVSEYSKHVLEHTYRQLAESAISYKAYYEILREGTTVCKQNIRKLRKIVRILTENIEVVKAKDAPILDNLVEGLEEQLGNTEDQLEQSKLDLKTLQELQTIFTEKPKQVKDSYFFIGSTCIT